jgi:hypothetical protein
VEELGAGEILLNCIDCDGIFTVAEWFMFCMHACYGIVTMFQLYCAMFL